MNRKEKSLEEVCEEYKLSQKEHEELYGKIKAFILKGKTSVKNPIAIIDIAPPGSGKTGLNGLGVNQFPNNNVIVINSDELKPYHPKIDEIAKLYPGYYTKVTNQESNDWTDSLVADSVSGKYNIIYEGTGRNIKLLQKMISEMQGYKIVVRAMAVNELNCLMSIIERYKGQLKHKGWGRLVTLEHFYKAYSEILDTIKQLEQMDEIDLIEVYMRGEKPSEPVRIYSSGGKEFENANVAMTEGRKNDFDKAKKYYEDVFRENFPIEVETMEEMQILSKIDLLFQGKQTEIEL